MFDVNCLKVYLVGGSQDTHHDPAELLDKVEQALKAGITAFQYREKGDSSLNAEEKLTLGRKLQALCKKYQVPFIIDDDVDLALELQADGIHVGQSDRAIQKVIDQVSGKMFIGYSCSTLAEVEEANELPIDYVGSGPIFPTLSKLDADPVIGTDGVQKLVLASKNPIVAIGGISLENVSELASSGVKGIAVISMILQSSDIAHTVEVAKAVKY